MPDKENLRGMVTYILALVERSPKKFQEELENIDFITKPDVMSTLSMLRAEGIREGLRKGEKKGETVSDLKHLLRIFTKFPNLSVADYVSLTEFKKEAIETFLKVLKTKKTRAIQFHIRKRLLKGIELSKADKKKIYLLVKTLVMQDSSK